MDMKALKKKNLSQDRSGVWFKAFWGDQSTIMYQLFQALWEFKEILYFAPTLKAVTVELEPM